MLINATTDIALISIAIVLFSQLLQNKFIDRKKMKEHQEKMREHQKRIQELIKQNDKKSQEELKTINDEIMKSTSEMMQASLRFMIITTPIFLIMFFAIGSFYGNETINLPFPIPWIDGKVYNQTNWIGWYVLCAIIASIIIKIILNIIEKVRT